MSSESKSEEFGNLMMDDDKLRLQGNSGNQKLVLAVLLYDEGEKTPVVSSLLIKRLIVNCIR